MKGKNGYNMKNELDAEKNYLYGLYIEDLERIVNYGGKDRHRVRHPNNWKRIEREVLREGIELPLDLTNKKVWVWSDQHFYHKNIIRFSERPYMNIDEMTEVLIANHNDYVGKDDVCIWVGDVGFGNDRNINNVLRRCHGYKILVVGNHDLNKGKVRHLDFDEIYPTYLLENMLFTHYPMNNIPWPWFNVHGHIHAGGHHDVVENPLHYNVNLEFHGYKPIDLDEVKRIVKIRIEAYDKT